MISPCHLFLTRFTIHIYMKYTRLILVRRLYNSLFKKGCPLIYSTPHSQWVWDCIMCLLVWWHKTCLCGRLESFCSMLWDTHSFKGLWRWSSMCSIIYAVICIYGKNKLCSYVLEIMDIILCPCWDQYFTSLTNHHRVSKYDNGQDKSNNGFCKLPVTNQKINGWFSIWLCLLWIH